MGALADGLPGFCPEQAVYRQCEAADACRGWPDRLDHARYADQDLAETRSLTAPPVLEVRSQMAAATVINLAGGGAAG